MALHENIFRAKCWKCGQIAEPGEAWREGSPGKNWKVIHKTCVPVVAAKLPEGLEYDL